MCMNPVQTNCGNASKNIAHKWSKIAQMTHKQCCGQLQEWILLYVELKGDTGHKTVNVYSEHFLRK